MIDGVSQLRKRIWYSPPCSFLPHQYGRIDEHILDKDTVANGGIVDQDVRHRAHDLAVLNDRAAAHECVQVGTTIINRNLIIESIHRLKSKL